MVLLLYYFLAVCRTDLLHVIIIFNEIFLYFLSQIVILLQKL